MISKFISEHDYAIKPQNLGLWLMKSSQSNFNLRLPSSYLARSYLIATVSIMKKCLIILGQNIEFRAIVLTSVSAKVLFVKLKLEKKI